MAMSKKSAKSKFMPDDLSDFINESQFLKDSPKTKKVQKRQKPEPVEDGHSSKINSNISTHKKKRNDEGVEVCRESRQKLLNVMSHQIDARKQTNNNLLNNLSEVVTHLEADYNALKDNEQKLEHLTGAFIKCIQQATNAHKQKLKALKEIHTSFKKEVEGLLSRGAMKPDDRPLWFDVYKAFPPIEEPKFARPKPEAKPIRQILYKEDIVRAKFHTAGHGLGMNMLSPAGETQTKRLIQQYEKLKSENVPENELIEKSVAAVSADRQAEFNTISPKNPDSVTAQVLAEADIKNIFKE